MQQSSATHSLHLSFWGLRRIVACCQSSQCLLVSNVFGMVPSLHPTSDFYTVYSALGVSLHKESAKPISMPCYYGKVNVLNKRCVILLCGIVPALYV